MFRKKLLSMFLVVAMILTLLPVMTVFAEGEPDDETLPTESADTDVDEADDDDDDDDTEEAEEDADE